MDQREKIMKIAASQVGYKESGKDITKYGAWYGMNGNPWCAMFVSWCAAQAGVPQSVIPKKSYVPDIVSFYISRGRYRTRGSYTPKKGDIVFFGESDHVGLVEGVSGNNVITIEGNTSSGGNVSNGEGVYRRTRPLGSSSWVMGFGIPAYQKEEEDKEVERWKTIKDVPAGYYREQAQRLMSEGVLKGKGNGEIDLTEDMLRTILIIERMLK